MAPPSSVEPENPQGQTADPLESLHRMSRTAGVGTQEYVAVNAAAVAAFLLGVLSVAAIASDVLLILPVAAVIISLVALVQIKGSGGTQTGRGLAVTGLVLALVFVAWVGGRAWMRQRAISDAQDEIVALVERLSKDVTSGDYNSAWGLFGQRFKEQIWKRDFVNGWTALHKLPGYGPIKGIRWNTRLEIQIDPQTDVRFANGVVLVDGGQGEPDRWSAAFRYYPDRGWVFEDLETPLQWFPRHDEMTLPTPILPPPE